MVAKFEAVLEQKIPAALEMLPYRLSVDYHPCRLLAEALAEAGIKSKIGTLPCKSSVKIEVGKVTASGGYSSGSQVIWQKD